MGNNSVSPLRPDLNVEIKPTNFDRTNAALVTAIMLAGFLFAAMFCIWLSGACDFSNRIVTPLPPDNPVGETVPEGLAEDLLEPGAQEFPELATFDLAKSLLAVTDTVSNVQASLNKKNGQATRTSFGLGDGHRKGEDPKPGPIGTPVHKRWSIVFEADDINAYANQLAFFKIDVAAIHKFENEIWRVQQVAGAAKVVKSNRQEENDTLRFSHKNKRLQGWDKEICRRSGIKVEDVITAQFYPDSVRKIMAAAEAAAVAKTGRKVEEVRKTTFRVIPAGEEFQFEVVDVLYH